ncbi:MAG TPA: DUF6134 family protein [Acetobacteraceae bacterium]
MIFPPVLSRRGLLAGAAAALAAPALAALPVPAERRLAFRVMRKGSAIGTHVLEFEPRGDALTVRIAVDLAVGWGGVVVYRYTLRGTEEWGGGEWLRASVHTDDDGEKHFLEASREGGRMMVQGSRAARYSAPPGTHCGTHWNKAGLAGPMVNMQTGELMRFAVTPRGRVAVTASGRSIGAEQYDLRGPAEIDVWYDDAGAWAALRMVAKEGSVVTYERV